jgi:hypothetical protein
MFLVSFLCAIVFFLAIYFGWFVVCVSDTEEHLMPALNFLFWDQVVEANRHFFRSSVYSPWFSTVIIIHAKSPKACVKAKRLARFVG